MFYVISQPFLKISTLKFCTRIYQPLPSNILYVFFVKILILREKMLKRKKMLEILEIFRNFQHLEIPR